MSAALDRRLTPATERIALESLRGVLARPAYTPGRPMRLAVPLADLPIGMITSLVGGPFFLWLLVRTRRRSGGWA